MCNLSVVMKIVFIFNTIEKPNLMCLQSTMKLMVKLIGEAFVENILLKIMVYQGTYVRFNYKLIQMHCIEILLEGLV